MPNVPARDNNKKDKCKELADAVIEVADPIAIGSPFTMGTVIMLLSQHTFLPEAQPTVEGDRFFVKRKRLTAELMQTQITKRKR